MGSALGIKCDLILALRTQTFEYLSVFFYRHAVECLESAHSEEKKNQKSFFLLKHPTNTDF